MKKLIKSLLLATLMVASVASCIDDGIQEPLDAGLCKEIAAIDDQVEAVEASMKDAKALSKALGAYEKELDGVVGAMKQHVSVLKAGLSQEASALATFELQKEIAGVVGTIRAQIAPEDYKGDLKAHFDALESGITGWLGNTFTLCYPMAFVNAVSACVMAEIEPEMQRQELYISALVSDVEAGLRKDEKPEELASLAASVKKNAEEAAQMSKDLAQMSENVDSKYEAAVKAMCSSASEYDASELAALNDNVRMEVRAVDNSLAGLASRVAACESQLEDILTRLGALESTVTDLNKLLEMIQSLTFMSEYSEDKAVAYYTLNKDGAADAKGRKPRTPEGTIDFKYVVRPASAAAALTSEEFWNSNFKIFGYYAQSITKAAGDFFDFTIKNVVADQLTGVATITVENALNSNFFFRETGAKVALSVATGKTDLTSKFVEIVPKDNSGTVYVETLELSAKSIEVDNGTKAGLDAFITPDNVTVGGVTWTTSDANVVNVNENGVIEGMSVGSAVITATTKGIDEWGNALVAQCSVKVNPAIKLSGPSYVEAKGNITIRIESPDYIDPESVTWTSSAPTLAAITKTDDGNALISGEAMYYNQTDKAYTPITITCDIDGKATLSHEIRVIAVQPKGIAIEGLSSGQNALTLKKGQEYTFNSTVQPAEVDMTLFRFRYQSNNTGVVNVPDMNIGKVVANTIGSATVSVKVTDQGQYNYFYPARNEYVRYVDVTVEPYYVTGITLPTTWEMKPGEEGSISATFTSDGGENVQPTDMTLSWTSDNSSVVEVDAVTGKMTAKEVGTALITATSTSVPSGSQPVIASCVVTVKEASAADAKVGDYYYSDGTWSTERDAGKTVIGIVFSTLNAIGEDSKLREDYPACSNGLVISVKEMSSIFGQSYGFNDQNNGNEMYYWLSSNYALANYSTTVANGYTATLGLKGYQQYRNATDCCQIVSVLNDPNLPAAPTDKPNSGWYIPSYKEMQLLNAERTVVNSAISNVGGNQIGEGDYWTSSLTYTHTTGGNALTGPKNFYYTYCYPFNMTNNAWTASHSNATNYPVRVVLAF